MRIDFDGKKLESITKTQAIYAFYDKVPVYAFCNNIPIVIKPDSDDDSFSKHSLEYQAQHKGKKLTYFIEIA